MADNLTISVNAILKKLAEENNKVNSKIVVGKLILHEFIKQFHMTWSNATSTNDIPASLLTEDCYAKLEYEARTFSRNEVEVLIVSNDVKVELLFRVSNLKFLL